MAKLDYIPNSYSLSLGLNLAPYCEGKTTISSVADESTQQGGDCLGIASSALLRWCACFKLATRFNELLQMLQLC